jgi:NitT/TauT family transport system substrate-binding protein
MRRGFAAGLLALGLALGAGRAWAEDLGTVRIGVLKFGTVNWELDVIKHHGLDRKAGFTLEVQGFGSNEAADVALLGGAADGIVEDWLWVSRQRASGLPLTFIPYSSSIGSLVVRADSGIETLGDLAGRKIGVAGGPLDKSWILIQGMAKEKAGIDLAEDAEPVYGAPPLLAEKLRQGELPAVLDYWNYAAGLVAEGNRPLVSVSAAEEALGVPGDTVQLGYVFKEGWVDNHAKLVQAFSDASREAKKIMAESDAVLDALMAGYRTGIPEHWGTPEREAARKLYAVLAQLGGEDLVGPSPVLAPGTFWDGVRY